MAIFTVLTKVSLLKGVIGNKKKAVPVLIVLALALLSWWAYSSIHDRGYNKGVERTERIYERAMEQARLEFEEEVARLEFLKEETELELTSRLSALEAEYEQVMEETLDETANIIDQLRNDNIRLYNSIGRTGGSDTRTTDTTSSTGSCDGAEGGQLSTDVAEFLIREADRADRYTRQLTLCQAVVASYVEAVNEYNRKVQQLNAVD